MRSNSNVHANLDGQISVTVHLEKQMTGKEGKEVEAHREGLRVAEQARGRSDAANWTAADGARRRGRRARSRLFLAFQLDSFPLQPRRHRSGLVDAGTGDSSPC